jgi:hypothetical protein
MICSSVNLDRFIRPSLPSGRTLRIFGGASGGQVISPRLNQQYMNVVCVLLSKSKIL